MKCVLKMIRVILTFFFPFVLTATTACGAYLPGQLEILSFLATLIKVTTHCRTHVPSGCLKKRDNNQMTLPCLPDNALWEKNGKEQNSYITCRYCAATKPSIYGKTFSLLTDGVDPWI